MLGSVKYGSATTETVTGTNQLLHVKVTVAAHCWSVTFAEPLPVNGSA